MAEGPHVPAMPLTMVRVGDTRTVRSVRGGGDVKRHLESLGFVEGSQVHVVAANPANIIVNIKGARLGLDSKVAGRVMTV